MSDLKTIYPIFDPLGDEVIASCKEKSPAVMVKKMLDAQATAIEQATQAGVTEPPWNIAREFSSLVFQRMLG